MTILKYIIDGIKTSPYSLLYSLTYLYFSKYPQLKNKKNIPIENRYIAAKNQDTCNILFFGDLIATPEVPEFHAEILKVFQRANLIIGNLEGPLKYKTIQEWNIAEKTKTSIWSKAISKEFLDNVINKLGIDKSKLILSIANNHSQDFGDEGLKSTINFLKQMGITAIGYKSPKSQFLIEHKIPDTNINLLLCAWSQWLNTPPGYKFRDPEKIGIWRVEDLPAYINKPKYIKTVIAFPHWDYEYQHFPHTKTQNFAKHLSDIGFDLIVGSHPHVIQPIQKIAATYCLYSLGNFMHPGHEVSSSLSSAIGALWEVVLHTSGVNKGEISGYIVHPLFHDRKHNIIRLVQKKDNEKYDIINKIYA